jgi:hypothetical protein
MVGPAKAGLYHFVVPPALRGLSIYRSLLSIEEDKIGKIPSFSPLIRGEPDEIGRGV